MHNFFLVILLFINSIAWGQKYALVGDVNQFVCKSDSLKHYFKIDYLDSLEIDTVATFNYWYDDGRYEQEVAALIWKYKNEVMIKAIYGCDNIQQTSIMAYPDQQMFANYVSNNLMQEQHYLSSSWSHEFGYSFDLNYGDIKEVGYVRDSNRGENNFEEEVDSIKAIKREIADKNPLVYWLNGVNDILRRDSAYLLNVVTLKNEQGRDENLDNCQQLYELAIDRSSSGIRLPKQAPKDLEEGIDILTTVTSEAVKDWARCLPDRQFSIIVHHSLGQNIRNTWKLWRKSALSEYMNELGIDHPDDMSSILLDSFQRRLKNEDVRLDDQIEYYQNFWEDKD